MYRRYVIFSILKLTYFTSVDGQYIALIQTAITWVPMQYKGELLTLIVLRVISNNRFDVNFCTSISHKLHTIVTLNVNCLSGKNANRIYLPVKTQKSIFCHEHQLPFLHIQLALKR